MKFKVYFHPIELSEPSLWETPKILNSVYVDSISLGEFMSSVIHSVVSLLSHQYYPIIESVISRPAISIYYCIFERYLPFDYRKQSFFCTVGYDLSIYLHSSEDILSFYKTKYWLFLCSSSSFEFTCKSSFSSGSEVAFVCLYSSSYFFLELFHSMSIYYFSEDIEIVINSISI